MADEMADVKEPVPPRFTKKPKLSWRPVSRPRRVDWQAPYLAQIRATGLRYASAHAVGVNRDTVDAERTRNPAFADALEETLEIFRDSVLEAELLEVGRGTRKGNPLPYFALLKKHRPGEYHDKLVSLNANLSVSVEGATVEQARALLGQMLAMATPTTMRMLERANPPTDQAHAAASDGG